MSQVLSLLRLCLLAMVASDILGRIGLGILSPIQAFCLFQLWALLRLESISNGRLQALVEEEKKLDGTAEKWALKLSRILIVGMVYGFCRLALWVAS